MEPPRSLGHDRVLIEELRIPIVWSVLHAWYPNDRPVENYGNASMHMMEQAVSVAELANWGSRDMSWSAEGIAPGRYYFVVEVDPGNANSAHRLFRSEFGI
jgi:hypothetical protein